MYLTVDLASKFSAAILRDRDGKILWQGDSGKDSAFGWVTRLKDLVDRLDERGLRPDILVEDVPYGISNQKMVKPVLRLQGALIWALEGYDIYWINPSTWQKTYEGVGRAPKGLTKAEGDKYRIEKAASYARELGYEAPDLVGDWIKANPDLKPLKKYTAPLDKARTDYTDAFLMNVWLEKNIENYKTLTGVQPSFI